MGYVIAGWLSVAAALGGYAAYTIARGRRLSRQVPPERRRWT